GRLIRLNALAARLAPYYTDEASAYRRSSSYE
ncbi:transcriptional regulator, partial [Escherichia coli]|nr:transcriptional regulator [Escherichia coli]